MKIRGTPRNLWLDGVLLNMTKGVSAIGYARCGTEYARLDNKVDYSLRFTCKTLIDVERRKSPRPRIGGIRGAACGAK